MKSFSSVDSLLTEGSTCAVSDIVGCLRLQSDQVFIGMITMQYQAKQVRGQLVLVESSENNTYLRQIVFVKNGSNKCNCV